MGKQVSTFRQMIELSQRMSLDSQKTLCERLEHYSVYSDRIIALKGAPGTGRSTLLSLLIEAIEPPIAVAKLTAEDHFQQTFADQLSLNEMDTEQDYGDFLASIPESKEVLLLIDEADYLPDELLFALDEKVKSDTFHCVVVVNEHMDKDSWYLQHHEQVLELLVPTISDDEAVGLIAHKMQLSDSQLLLIVDEKKVDNIVRQCNGNIGLLTEAAEELSAQLNRQQATASKAEPTANLIRGAGFVAIAVLLALVLIFQDSVNQLFKAEEAKPVVDTPVIEDKASEPEEVVALATDSETSDVEKESLAATSWRDQSVADQETKTAADEATTQARDNTGNANVVQNAIVDEPSQPSEQTVPQDSTATQPTEQLPSKPSSMPPPKQRLVPPIDDPVVDSLPVQTKPAESKPATGYSLTAMEKELLTVGDAGALIQVAGFSELKNVETFLQAHQNQGNLQFYRTLRNNKLWFVVVVGPYSSMDEARNQRGQLVAALQKSKPWVKSMQQVKSEIRQLTTARR
ncbi:SPOR domain-containing protein [Pleionea sp. CnH1-48]|uniref:SPOR domain-containing protein n=1 Tax=Pleionea sp. CnH1-48 TaxID=2954494 RepID=UPI002096F01F|nr:SPOR domain-containing protein [Pleionea sp. CnH1-48]MCO7224473.1 SPOR domain-containing protein [Pleionea sp. CnH1-48]